MDRTGIIQIAALAGVCAVVAGCKPPPTDAGMDRDLPVTAPTFASDPLPSPETEEALWVRTSDHRIVYGIPGEPALMALECLTKDKVENNRVSITRISAADEGAGALMALIGNNQIGRIEVDATEISGRLLWHGDVAADDATLEPLIGEEEVTATVPGGGMVTLNPSALPTELLAVCRGIARLVEPEPEPESEPEASETPAQ